jgi:hypothetical protein
MSKNRKIPLIFQLIDRVLLGRYDHILAGMITKWQA